MSNHRQFTHVCLMCACREADEQKERPNTELRDGVWLKWVRGSVAVGVRVRPKESNKQQHE